MKFEKKILENMETLLRKTNLSDKTICKILRIIHTFIPITIASVILFGSKKWVHLIIVLDIIIFIMFITFGDCILTKLERRFDRGNDVTILDPFLNFINVETTNTNRKNYTILLFTLCFFILCVIYYIRFIYRWGKQKLGSQSSPTNQSSPTSQSGPTRQSSPTNQSGPTRQSSPTSQSET